jgi:GAF domain-containing protein
MMTDPLGVELARIAAEIGPALVPPGHQELLTSITATARKLFGAEACSIAKLSEDESELIFCAATGGADAKIVGSRLPAGDGIAGWVTMTGQPLAVEQVADDPHWAAEFAASMGYLPQSMLAVPMETPRGVIGVIEVLDAAPETGHDIELLSLFAAQAALAIESARAFNDLGRALFHAAGSVASSHELSSALEQVAAAAPSPSGDLAELAVTFAELSRLGELERTSATRLLREFLAYAQRTPEVP